MNMRSATLVLSFLMVLGSLNAQLNRADKNYGHLKYSKAIKLYERYLDKNPRDQHAIERVADCYRRVNDFQMAEDKFAQVVQFKETDPINYYYYGRALMNNQKWSQATPWFEKYLGTNPEDQKVARAMLRSCQNYTTFMVDSSLYRVKITNINTPDADFSPHIWNDKVVFASARNREPLKFGWTSRPFLELFASDYKGTPQLGSPELLPGQINSKFHEAHVTFSPDGKTMFFSRNNLIKGKVGRSSEGVIRLKTYRADLRGKGWKNIEEIPFNDDEYSLGHPALSADGTTLFFVSDMQGGYGGTDLYKVSLNLETGTWGRPQNLGAAYNTTGDEMFPWISKDGTLYFSSTGWPGLGGLDLFRATNYGSSEEKVENMGYPINSARDDFALVLDETKRMGFFSSNRSGGVGDDDIYSFFQFHKVKGVVVDLETGERLGNVMVEVFDPRGEASKGRTDEDGVFVQGVKQDMELYAIATKEGYEEARKRFSSRNVNLNDEIVVEIPMKRLPSNCPEPIVFEGLLVDEEGKPLVKKKVKVIERVKVIETDENGMVYTEIDPTKEYEFVYEGPDTKEPLATNIDTRALVPEDTARARLLVPDPELGDVFYIIYYNFDMYNIRDRDARPELDRVVNFMQDNPNVTIQLTSHTDCRGTDAYNQTLSQNRAKSARRYIIDHGINGDRLTFRWKGEEELTNECADGIECTEEAHQLNRRTEFKITGTYKVPKN